MLSAGAEAQYTSYKQAGDASRLTYEVDFPEAGTYFVFIRGRASNDTPAYCHVGVDRYPQLGGDRIGHFNTESESGDYVWLNHRRIPGTQKGQLGNVKEDPDSYIRPRALITVPFAGRHRLNVWTGASGLVLDQIVLARDALTTVNDAGIHNIVFDPGEGQAFDVVIYGGTTVSGRAAGIQAVRQGASVLLLERTQHIGNISINGVNGTEGHTPLDLGHQDGNTWGA